MMKKRIVVAMSGGVDSSVAAALLVRQGHEVIGITMRFGAGRSSDCRPHCCSSSCVADARKTASKLGIKHYVVDLENCLKEKVIKDFCRQYLNGKTPNPCVRCNQYIKFGCLLKKGLSLGADYFATGHYARIIRDKKGIYWLAHAADLNKDQSYFLYRLNQYQLKHAIFPLRDYTKPQVKKIAADLGIVRQERHESQEICFIPADNYREFLRKHASVILGRQVRKNMRPGEIVDKNGKLLGFHKGAAFYTIGQRQGLGIACGSAVYVVKIDIRNNRVIVGSKADASGKEFILKRCHWVLPLIKKKVAADVKIRYNHTRVPAEIIPSGNHIIVKLEIPQFAVTPGQSAVFYLKDRVIGGGIIS